MNNQIKNPIGDLINNKLDELKLSTKELSEILGVTYTYVSSIVNGSKTISVELAFMISKVLNIDPLEILNKQNEYELSKIHNKADKIEDKMFYSELWKKYKSIVPIKQFEKLELIEGNVKEKIDKINLMYGVNSTDEILRKVSAKSINGFFRKSVKIKNDYNNILAWEVASKEIARNFKVSNFDYTSFKNNILLITGELKNILTNNVNVIDEIKKLLNTYGIKFEVVNKFDKTPIDGFSFKSGDNPAIIMTLRYKRLDNFAFTLFHEIGHIFCDFESMESKDFIEMGTNKIEDEYEKRANDFANDYLYGSNLIERLRYIEFMDDQKLKELRREFNLHEQIILGAYKHFLNKFRIKSDIENKIG